nr:tetraacyldisaccharide 4'-kinase [Acuticoccus kalidii]
MAPIGGVVGMVAARRMHRPAAATVEAKVICIGNPTVGGAGKTPVAIAVARLLLEAGHRPVFLTRGYGGRLKGPLIIGDEGAADVGDEALLLAAIAPTVVSRDRAAGGRLAACLGDVIVMDDGFQNPGLAKDWSALVIDRAVGVGNARVTPAGPLRAPLAAHAPLADGLIVVDAGEGIAAPLPDLGVPIFTAHLEPTVSEPLDGVPVLAFAGIGRPEKFFASVRALGATLVEARPFADHHAFEAREITGLRDAAAKAGLKLVTTRKDHVRLATGSDAAQRLAADCLVVDVSAVLDPALGEVLRGIARG